MKKGIRLALLIWLSIYSLPSAFGQEDENVHTSDSEDVAVEKINSVHQHVLFALDAGPTYSMLLIDNSSYADNPILGGRIGGCMFVPLAGKLYLQPGLYFAASGGKSTEIDNNGSTSFWVTDRLYSVELPVSIGFRYGHHKRTRKYKSFVGIGPYVAYTLAGTLNNSDNRSGSLQIGNNATSDIRPLDYGIGYSNTTDWPSGFFMHVRIQYGIANQAEEGGNAIHSFNCMAQFGYLFGNYHANHRRLPARDDNYLERRME